MCQSYGRSTYALDAVMNERDPLRKYFVEIQQFRRKKAVKQQNVTATEGFLGEKTLDHVLIGSAIEGKGFKLRGLLTLTER